MLQRKTWSILQDQADKTTISVVGVVTEGDAKEL